MARYLINVLPWWVYSLLVVLIFVGFGLFFDWVLRRFFSQFALLDSRKTLAVFSVITMSYSILLGFTIIILWQTMISARTAVVEEANQLGKILVYSRSLSPDVTNVVSAPVLEYLNIVVNEEWSDMKWGNYSTKADKIVDKILLMLTTTLPRDNKGQLIFKEIITSFDKALEARLARLAKIESAIPNGLLFLIFISSILLIVLVCAISDPDRKRRMIPLLIVCLVVGINMGLIMEIDFPFGGDIAVDDTPFVHEIADGQASSHIR